MQYGRIRMRVRLVQQFGKCSPRNHRQMRLIISGCTAISQQNIFRDFMEPVASFSRIMLIDKLYYLSILYKLRKYVMCRTNSSNHRNWYNENFVVSGIHYMQEDR